MITSLHIDLPPWVGALAASLTAQYPTPQAQVRLAIDLAGRNVAEGTGGPFGAAVFDADSGVLVSVGVNLVTRENASILHAEMVALTLAQQTVGSFDLSSGPQRLALATSCEPCAMCLGAIPWSGVCAVVCGAREEDARAVGFDEGEKPHDWVAALERRGITVVRDVLRAEGADVLRGYAASGGLVYNGRRTCPRTDAQ